MCGESVLRGSNIFVKGIQSMERTCTKGEKVCIVVDICNTKLPRGSALGLYDGKNLYILSFSHDCHRIIGEGVLQLTRSEVFSLESGLAIDHIHRCSCFSLLLSSLSL